MIFRIDGLHAPDCCLWSWRTVDKCRFIALAMDEKI